MTVSDTRIAVVDSGPGDEARLASLLNVGRVTVSHGPAGADEIVKRAAGATVLVTLYTYTRVSADVIARLPDLQLIITRTAGFSHIDAGAAAAHGIAVATVPEAPTNAVAEYTFAALMMLRRNLAAATTSTRSGGWAFTDFGGGEMAGSTLGVLGLGRIGRRVAELGRSFGMDVLGWSRSRVSLEGVQQVALDELLSRSSAVSVNVPLTPQTAGLLGANELERLPRGAHLVNTARGEVLDIGALCALLRSGHIGGACLDVLQDEPVAGDRLAALAGVPNLLITPHISWHTSETLERQFDGLARKVLAFIAGDDLRVVNDKTTEGADSV